MNIINGVYYVDSPDMNHIAIRPEILKSAISWEDTSHGKVLNCTQLLIDGKNIDLSTPIVLNKIPDTIEIITEKGTCKLQKLTAKIFNEKLKNSVPLGKNKIFKDDNSIQQFYLDGNFYG